MKLLIECSLESEARLHGVQSGEASLVTDPSLVICTSRAWKIVSGTGVGKGSRCTYYLLY